MNKDELVFIMKAEKFTEEHLVRLDSLISEYPWFGLPRFIKLKAMQQLGKEADPMEVCRAVLYSSDRSYLYNWIGGGTVSMVDVQGETGSELEFITDEDALKGMDDSSDHEEEILADGEFTMVDEDVSDEEASEKSLPEKDESEMEEPEVLESEAVPVMDPIDNEEEEVSEESNPEKIDGKADIPASTAGQSANHSNALIEQFLNSEAGVIKADKETALAGDVSEGSVKEDDSFITDTLAKIYVKQGLHAKAIYAYERLSLKYPEKSAYFAAQIEKIKNISHL